MNIPKIKSMGRRLEDWNRACREIVGSQRKMEMPVLESDLLETDTDDDDKSIAVPHCCRNIRYIMKKTLI